MNPFDPADPEFSTPEAMRARLEQHRDEYGDEYRDEDLGEYAAGAGPAPEQGLASRLLDLLLVVIVWGLIGWVVWGFLWGFFRTEPSRIANIEPSRIHLIERDIRPSDVYLDEPSSNEFLEPSSGGCGLVSYGPYC